MKKIKLVLAFLAVVLMAPSCSNDGGDSKISTIIGAVPDINKTENTDAFIDLNSIQSGDNITIGVTIDLAQGQASSMDVVGVYVKLDGTAEKAVLTPNVTTFPSSFSYSQNDLINAFDLLTSATDFQLGDQLIISADVTLKDGTVLNLVNADGSANYSPNIANSSEYSVTQTYSVSCPSDLGGTYSVLTSGTSTDSGPTADENPITNFPYSVTITDNGGGNYTISDAFGGVYILWYDIYGLDFEVEGTFTDVCGTLSGTFAEPFGSDVEYTGTVNEDGTLTLHWVNGFGDMGDSVYTKTN